MQRGGEVECLLPESRFRQMTAVCWGFSANEIYAFAVCSSTEVFVSTCIVTVVLQAFDPTAIGRNSFAAGLCWVFRRGMAYRALSSLKFDNY